MLRVNIDASIKLAKKKIDFNWTVHNGPTFLNGECICLILLDYDKNSGSFFSKLNYQLPVLPDSSYFNLKYMSLSTASKNSCCKTCSDNKIYLINIIHFWHISSNISQIIYWEIKIVEIMYNKKETGKNSQLTAHSMFNSTSILYFVLSYKSRIEFCNFLLSGSNENLFILCRYDRTSLVWK